MCEYNCEANANGVSSLTIHCSLADSNTIGVASL